MSNINAQNITVTNLTVTNINGRPAATFCSSCSNPCATTDDCYDCSQEDNPCPGCFDLPLPCPSGGGAATNAFYVNPIRNTLNTTSRLMMYDTTTSEIWYSGANAGNASKTFVIDHPLNENKYLVHGCLEGPEAGVYYRGKAEIINNKSITILLPDYVKKLATDFTIQITPIYSGKNEKINQLNVTEVENNSFTVYGENGKFFWLVQGNRFNIEVEPLKDSVQVKGNGPYKWI